MKVKRVQRGRVHTYGDGGDVVARQVDNSCFGK